MINFKSWDYLVIALLVLFIGYDVGTFLAIADSKFQDLTVHQWAVVVLFLRVMYVVLREFFYIMSWKAEWFGSNVLRVFDSLGYDRFHSTDESGNPKPNIERVLQDAEVISQSNKQEKAADVSSEEEIKDPEEAKIGEDVIVHEDGDYMVSANKLTDRVSNTIRSRGEIIKYIKKNLIISGSAVAMLNNNNMEDVVRDYVDEELLTRGDYSHIDAYKSNGKLSDYIKDAFIGNEEKIAELVAEFRKDRSFLPALNEALTSLPKSHMILGAYFDQNQDQVVVKLGRKGVAIDGTANNYMHEINLDIKEIQTDESRKA